MKINVYSTSTCATCHLVTEWLEKNSLDYEKKNTDENETFMQEFMSVNDGMIGVPFTVIEKDNGEKVKISGFDLNKFKEATEV
jgi:glutaredoxin